MTLQELQKLYGLTLNGDKIYIYIGDLPDSIVCPLNDLSKCVLITQAEFESLMNNGEDNQNELLTLERGRI